MSREIRSPVYQIDFTAVDAGKRVASTKRRIRWRFGFTNQDALASGCTGTECRGEEHDITFIWSIASGKRLVLADGQEVHYSNSRNHVFDFSWTMRGNHVLKVTAHANAPINAHPNFRQYDFFVDGMSFFSMPKVYRLGLTDSAPIYESGTLAIAQSSRVPGTYGGGRGPDPYGMGVHRNVASAPAQTKKSLIAEIETPHNADEEEAYLKEAIKQSLSEAENAKEKDIPFGSNQSLNEPASSAPDLLLDFMSEPGPVPAPAPNANALVSSSQQPVDQFGFGAAAPMQQQPFAQPSYGGAPGPGAVMAVDPFAPVPATTPSSVPPQMSSATSVASSFTNPPPAVVPGYNNSVSSFPSSSFAQPPPAPLAAPPTVPEQAPPPPPAAADLTMAPKDPGLGSDANAALLKFANMDQFDLVKPKVQAENPFDAPISSANAPPPAPTTLADMKAMNDGGGGGGSSTQVMNNSSMVVSGAQSGNWGVGAPPPPPAMMGQAPVMNQGYGYQQQQQQPYGAAAVAAPVGQPFQQPTMAPMGGAPMGQPTMQQQPSYGQAQFQQGYGQQY